MSTLGHCEKCHEQKLINKHGWCRGCGDKLLAEIETWHFQPNTNPDIVDPLPWDPFHPGHIIDKPIAELQTEINKITRNSIRKKSEKF